MRRRHHENHRVHRIGWLRAAVLGANDGIVSTASLMVGVAASGTSLANVLLSGVAGLVAGAMSMAAGEYVSVSSQSDTEQADLAKEQKELEEHPEHEHQELTHIYMNRGLDENLASQVATQMMAHDALGAHLRDELGITDVVSAQPVQAAFTSALTFSAGAFLPILLAILAPGDSAQWVVSVGSLVGLIVLGVLSANAGGAPVGRSTFRVAFWGAAAMALTALVGHFFGVAGA